MTVEAAEGICQSLGRVMHYNDEDEADGGEFMRVCVEIDITKPLSRGRRVRFGLSNEGWVSYRYERLPVARQETQRGDDSRASDKPFSPRSTQRTADVTPPTKPRDECITRMEIVDFQESSKIENSTSLAKILADNDKFQAHIKEIDIALNNNADSAVLTNNLDDDIECMNFEGADKETTDSRSGGPI